MNCVFFRMNKIKKPGSPVGASGLVALTCRSVARVYPFATRGLAPRMLLSRFQVTRIARDTVEVVEIWDAWRFMTPLPMAQATMPRPTWLTTARDNARPNAWRSFRLIVCAAVFTDAPSSKKGLK